MKYEAWEPYYKAILEDFGWTPEGDEEAARIMAPMLSDPAPTLARLKELINGRDVLVCGKAPRLKDDLKSIDRSKYTVIAADGATSTLLEAGIVPDIIVSDLDGSHADLLKANAKGAIVLAHAHADNIPAVREMVPKLKNVIGTTQARPFNHVYNFGGFSDGDRCVFLAKEFGARSIKIIGFDLSDTNVTPKKLKKLKWARKLLGDLGISL
jgi:2-amino-4-hydroxy-6-hydroxymethyldihydropteridine diphosphokinase